MYGYEMTKAVREMSAGTMSITEAALYPALHKLCTEGLLETSSELVDGRVRKYYSLSKKGKKQSVLEVGRLQEMLQALNLLLKPGTKHG